MASEKQSYHTPKKQEKPTFKGSRAEFPPDMKEILPGRCFRLEARRATNAIMELPSPDFNKKQQNSKTAHAHPVFALDLVKQPAQDPYIFAVEVGTFTNTSLAEWEQKRLTDKKLEGTVPIWNAGESGPEVTKIQNLLRAEGRLIVCLSHGNMVKNLRVYDELSVVTSDARITPTCFNELREFFKLSTPSLPPQAPAADLPTHPLRTTNSYTEILQEEKKDGEVARSK